MGEKSQKSALSHKNLLQAGKSTHSQFFGKAEGVVCLFSFQTGSLRWNCAGKEVLCANNAFLFMKTS